MKEAVKDIINAFFQTCETFMLVETDEQMKCEKAQLEEELFCYVAYLAASDGKITVYETQFMQDYFHRKMTPQELNLQLKEKHIYSTSFEQTVPDGFRKLIQFDEKHRSGSGLEQEPLSLTWFQIYKVLGREMIICDGAATEAEVQSYQKYLEMMKAYRDGTEQRSVQTAGAETMKEGSEAEAEAAAASEETLEQLLEKLNSLTGLEQVKQDLNSLIHLQELQKLRKERNMKQIPMSNHLVFSGNPGTGKTTVARMLAAIYHKIGILKKGQLVEVDRSGLVGGYVGQTALKVQETVKKALGGVLFIDEAYALVCHTGENDFGREAVETLLKAMEDYRDELVVIAAGYREEMEEFIDSNPGLRSRFNKYIYFPDYHPDELVEIFKTMCRNAGYTVSEEALDCTEKTLTELYENRDEHFANAREVRNFFEKAVLNQADRLFGETDLTDEQLGRLELADVEKI